MLSRSSIVLVLVFPASLVGCAHRYVDQVNKTRPVYKEPESNFARLRVSGQETYITPNSTCFDREKLGAGFAKKLDFLWNNRYPDRDIGMAKPKKGEYSRLNSWDPYSFYELKIQAGEPVTIMDRLNDLTTRCGPFIVSFTPQAGKDYQIRYSLLYQDGTTNSPGLLVGQSYCKIAIDEISPSGEFIPLKISPVDMCNKAKVSKTQ